MAKKTGLYKQFQQCHHEEEIKCEFAKFFNYKLDTHDFMDLYTPNILFEFKFDVNLNKAANRAKSIAQTLYYIRRLKYGIGHRTPCPIICVISDKYAFFVETSSLDNYYLSSKASKYDWDLAPSNPCKKLVNDLSECAVIQNIYVYALSISQVEEDFNNKIRMYHNTQIAIDNTKKEINERNFYEVFLYWQSLFGEYVENGRKSSEYFMTDIEDGRTRIYSDAQVLFHMTNGEYITKHLPISQYEYFWSVHEKINDKHTIMSIRQKMDRMTEINMRRFTGEFFTPLPFVDKSIDYIGRVIGSKWWSTGKYRLWDMAAGTGNLEFLLPAEAMKFCYISSLLEDDVSYCQKLYPDSVVFQYDYLNDDVNLLENPELFEKGVVAKMPQQLIKDLQNPDIKWIIYLNPPYVTSNNRTRTKKNKTKNSVSMTKIQELMTQERLGEVSRDLQSQFLYRISRQFSGRHAYLALFSKIKYINSANDQKLRETFFHCKYEKGFVFSSKEFQGCRAQFPVSFMIWNLNDNRLLNQQYIKVDVYNSRVEKYGVKRLRATESAQSLNKWIKRERSVAVMPPLSNAITVAYNNKDKRDKIAQDFLASLMCNGNEFAHQNDTCLFSAPYVSAGGLSITPRNFEQAMIVHTVRRLPQANWLNDRDQWMQPSVDVLSDREFVSDCVIWSLFANSNNATSMSNVIYQGTSYRIKNNLFPFLTSEIATWEINNDDINTQVWSKHEDRFAALWLQENLISSDGDMVLNCAKNVYKYFYKHFNNIAWPTYKIRNWDVGWWQVRMSLNGAGIGSDVLSQLLESHKKLGDKILPQLYQYGFMDYPIESVNT